MNDAIDISEHLPRPKVDGRPPAVRCSCGELLDWVWHEPRSPSTGRTWPGRWCAPKHSPCAACATPAGLDADMELRQRMRDAGIPEPLLGYRLETVGGYVVTQDDDEPWPDFRARVLELARHLPRIGVADTNREAIRRLAKWAPPSWLVVTGSVGTGKTLLLAALVRRLLVQQPDSVEELPDERVGARCQLGWDYAASRGLAQTIRRQAVPRIEYHRVDDLVRREALKLRGLDPAPTADAAKRPHVLVLDELGLSERPTEAEARLVERILCYRADHGLTTICASNRTWEELTMGERPLYGRRVADRLRGALSVELRGPSWRGQS